MKQKEPSPLERAIYLLEDIHESAQMLPAEGRRALAEGLEAARRQFAAAGSEGELQRAASDLLSLVEGHETWRRLLLPAHMPGVRQREQWLKIHEQELQDDPQQALDVEVLTRLKENIELGSQKAIAALLAEDEDQDD